MTYALWACFLVGGLLSVWKRAYLSASKDYTPWQNVKGYMVAHGPQIGMNFLLASGLFWTVWHDTSFLTKVLAYFGLQKDIEVPLNPFTAGIYGVFSDSIMDFVVAAISKKVPQLEARGETGVKDAANQPTQP
jgi:hypothetical protein